MQAPNYILGHKNPDADSICSAIAYAAFKRAIGEDHWIAARCGTSNARIDAILDRFKVPLPVFVGDLSPKVRDIMRTDVLAIDIDATCAQALEAIDEKDIRAMPVVDVDRRVLGIISIFNLGEFFIPKPKDQRRMRHIQTSISDIVKCLNASVLYSRDTDLIEDLYLRVGAMNIHSFGNFANNRDTKPRESIIVVGDRYDIQKKSIQLGVRLLVVTGNLALEGDIVEFAKEQGVSLIVSPYDSATTASIIRTATRLAPLIEKQFVSFAPDEKVCLVKRKVSNNVAPIYCVVNDLNRLVGIFTKTELLRPNPAKVILVDHNELSQAVNGVNEVDIVEIIDHHRLNNPPTHAPIYFRNEIIGSTSSIIATMFQERGLEPEPEIAGVLIGGIISDTLNLQSPTSTQRDADLLPWLSGIAKVEIQEIADLIFQSGSVIVSSNPKNIIEADCKHYTHNDMKFSVSQVEELGYQNFWKKADKIYAALKEFRTQHDMVCSCLLVTDINTQSSLLVIAGKDEIISEITYDVVKKNQIFDLPGIVSRKKQLIPYLTGIMSDLGFMA